MRERERKRTLTKEVVRGAREKKRNEEIAKGKEEKKLKLRSISL